MADDQLSTSQVARAAGCSAQQVRDLEAAGVIPLSERGSTGYRRFRPVHVAAVSAYRDLAAAVGPVRARALMRELAVVPADDALARLSSLHVDLARSRQEALHALAAVEMIQRETSGPSDSDGDGGSTMTISQLAEALDVRTSTLRFWEQEGLLHPERRGQARARSYPLRAIQEARIVAALRAGGYSIPATQDVMGDLRDSGGADALRGVLEARCRDIARRTELLLRVGTALVELLPALRRP
ncbi:MerR family transcriptional regulator [Brachybacterium sp. YJGR34]|uniref:MerR family transcriptional regulator n=1 Tax=Brachybacterium sp. YJGR34 TaxID=2059911 RepID=UPI00272D2407|nr:MerR family transcriptional regulator [Brachybacterium sp. YJGR34]